MLKRYFVTGLLVLVPLAITLWVLKLIITTMDQTLLLLPQPFQKPELFGYNLPGIGLVLTIAVVLLVGVLAHNFVGRKLVWWWERLLTRIPIVRGIYSSVKQVSDTVLSPSGQAFRKAVLVEFPRAGAWSVAFLIGTPGSEIEQRLGNLPQTVFVPTAPNPTSGYLIIVPPEQMTELDMSVDDALKFVISLGVVLPEKTTISTVNSRVSHN
ncbi:MAG: DUF502 domain-containing protein [Burkholderiaceae bacterium]|nr:DUF502 domain-containing protein [Burkholderiaceae bacterium]